jgi:hypothetical protein
VSGEPSEPEADASVQAGTGPLNYDDLPGLEDILLEESFIRELVEGPSQLRFVLMAALKRTHPFYEPPRSDERHCYRPATLTFPDAKVRWRKRTVTKFTDSDGAVDYGNIDMFIAPAEGGYHLEGDFGVIDVQKCRAPVFTILGASTGMRSYYRDTLDAWVKGTPGPGTDAPPAAVEPDHGHGHHHGHDHHGHSHAPHETHRQGRS